MKVFLGIPFREDPFGQRKVILDKLLPEFRLQYPYSHVEVADSGHSPFSRAGSRNKIVQMALSEGADVVVINDADSICENDVLQEAIENSYSDNRLHIPFTQVDMVSSSYLNRRYFRVSKLRAFHSYGPSCGGIFVIRPERWVHMGGQDERIKGWGCEDEITIVAANNFVDGYECHPGTLWSFQHQRLTGHEHSEANIRLRSKYHALDGNPIGLRVLQHGSNSFCTD